jgi:membrane protease YdiL (CAAX protease family)
MSILAPGFLLSFSPHVLPTIAGTTFSTHALLAATTMPADESNASTVVQWLGLGAAVALALVIALATGVFRPGRVDGPLRIPAGRPLWPMAMVIATAVAVWMGSNILYVAVKQAMGPQHERAAGTELPTSRPAVQPTMVDFAVLSTVPGLFGFAWLLFMDRQLTRTYQLQLGFTRGRFLDGVAKGLLASVMIMPIMFLAEVLLENLYLKLNYKHPGEHELLRLMNEAKTPVLRWCLIGGAIIAAPFFEEYLFRGFLQTFLRQTFVNWTMILSPRAPAPLPAGPLPGLPEAQAPAELPPAGAPPIMTLGYRAAAPAALPPPQGKRIWQTWVAILVTSLLFASVHEAWTAPLIFLLAVFLGYAYERTGSLWTTITIHLVFNSTSTIMYLMSSHGG